MKNAIGAIIEFWDHNMINYRLMGLAILLVCTVQLWWAFRNPQEFDSYGTTTLMVCLGGTLLFNPLFLIIWFRIPS